MGYVPECKIEIRMKFYFDIVNIGNEFISYHNLKPILYIPFLLSVRAHWNIIHSQYYITYCKQNGATYNSYRTWKNDIPKFWEK